MNELSKIHNNWRQDVSIYALGLLSIIALFIVGWSSYSAIQHQQTYQQNLMENEARSVTQAISHFIGNRLSNIQIFADENVALLSSFIEEGESGPAHDEVDMRIKRRFPNYFAYTIRTEDKSLIPDDLGELVGEVCRTDIDKFWNSQPVLSGPDRRPASDYRPIIHPQPGNYHFDTMAKWNMATGQKAVLFVSFHPVGLVNIIKHFQLPNHRIVIVRNDQKDLIELTAEGSRDKLDGNFRLSKAEQDSTIASLAVDNTRWTALVMPRTGFLDELKQPVINRAILLSLAIVFLWVGGIILLLRVQKQKQQAWKIIEEQNERFSSAQKVAHVGCWDWNMETGSLQWTDEIYSIFGRSKDDFGATYENFLGCIHPDDREKVIDAVDKAIHDKAPYEIQHRALLPDGSVSYVAEKGKVYFNADNKPVRMLGVVHDITNNVKLDQAKTEFVATVSHELRTPLTSIKGSLSFLSNDELYNIDSEAEKILEIANRNVDRLIDLVNDLLDLEKLQSGRMEFNFGDHELAAILTETVEACSSLAARQNVVLEIDQPLPEAIVHVDKGRLSQVIMNLLSNAIKFSDPDKVVQAGLVVEDDFVRAYVKDEGIGIPETFLDKVFDRFTQVDASDKRAKAGTGLGLSICRSIIEKHYGEIFVHSTLGEGSTFSFKLPKKTRSSGDKS